MYRCHICGLESKALNSILGKHADKHTSDEYTKAEYKRDLLIANGRPPKICCVCNKETVIPKGENEYPLYHRECYELKISQQFGDTNPNYKGGKLEVACAHCKKVLFKHPSHLSRELKFCSTSCSTSYYCVLENQTPEVTERLKNAKARLEANRYDPAVKEKIAVGQAKAFKGGCSKLEIDIFNKIKELMPNATNSEAIGFYTVDILIDKIVVEVQGDYWHTLPGAKGKDKRKNTYLVNKGYEVIYIWEHEWHEAEDKEILLKSKLYLS